MLWYICNLKMSQPKFHCGNLDAVMAVNGVAKMNVKGYMVDST